LVKKFKEVAEKCLVPKLNIASAAALSGQKNIPQKI